MMPPPSPPLPPFACGLQYNLITPQNDIPAGCPNGTGTVPGVTPSTIQCPALPGSADGGMLLVRLHAAAVK